jgi:PAS domain S-box-containing protein
MESPIDWLYLLEHWEVWGKWAGIVLVLVGLWQYVLRPIIKGAKAVNSTIQRLTDSLPVLLQIADEFRPNGGNSLRDVINRLETSMAISSQRDRAMFSYLDIAVFETDVTGAYTFVSKDWCTLTGLSPDQSAGDGWINCVVADQRDSVMLAWKRSISERREFALEYRIYAPAGHGQTMLINSRAFPSRRGAGSTEKIVGVVGIIRLSTNQVEGDVPGSHPYAR